MMLKDIAYIAQPTAASSQYSVASIQNKLYEEVYNEATKISPTSKGGGYRMKFQN